MSKATEQFGEWYAKKHVPNRILGALIDECRALDKQYADNVLWEYSNDVICELTLANVLADYILEDENLKKQIGQL